MRVANGREVSVNGRIYKGGDTLPALDGHVEDALVSTGTAERDDPQRDDSPGIRTHRK